jgi:predicted methyltransferase
MTSTRNTSRFALPLVLAVGLTAWAQVPPSPAQSASPEDRRATALKLPEILDALALSQGSQVADVGAGEGFLTARLAKVVGPGGRVYTVDIDDKFAIPKLKEMVEKQSLSNVTVIRSEPGDPKLPEGRLDAAIMLIVYHEVEPYQEMLAHVFASLKPGGRFVIVDNMPLKTRARPRADQAKNHVIAPEVVEPELRAAGFEIAARRNDFIDRPDEEEIKWMIVGLRPFK